MFVKRLWRVVPLLAVLLFGAAVASAQPSEPPAKTPDPNTIFKYLSGGKEYLDQDDIRRFIERLGKFDPSAKDRIERFMKQQGITNGRLTREQFALYFQQRLDERKDDAPKEEDIKASFRRLDLNGDSVLQPDEMPLSLRAELEKWDKNKNGVIEYDEYKAYYLTRYRERRERVEIYNAARDGWTVWSTDDPILTTTFREKERFTTRQQEGSLVLTVTGTVKDGKAAVRTIKVQDGTAESKYEALDKVPDEYRDKVARLIELSAKKPQ